VRQRTLIASAVARWELAPGSFLTAVWSHRGDAAAITTTARLAAELGETVTQAGADIVLVKLDGDGHRSGGRHRRAGRETPGGDPRPQAGEPVTELEPVNDHRAHRATEDDRDDRRRRKMTPDPCCPAAIAT